MKKYIGKTFLAMHGTIMFMSALFFIPYFIFNDEQEYIRFIIYTGFFFFFISCLHSGRVVLEI